MRYRLMASFQGASFQAGVGPTDEDVTLFAACPPPEELGFRSSSNHWRKRVSVDEIDALWESRPIGRYRGERCMVLDDLGDRMHIAYLGRDLYLARRLGFWEVDRGVFEVVVPRQEIDDLREERGEYELAALAPGDGNGHGGGWDHGSRETWAYNPRDYDQPAPDTGPLRVVGPQALIDTGPSWAADPHTPGLPAAAGWDAHDVDAQDPRDTGTWAVAGDPQATPEPGGPFPRGRGGWRARDTGGWEAPDTGAWDPREVERAAARERAAAAGWNDQGTSQAGSWNGRDPEQTGGWNGRDPGQAGGWNGRDPGQADGWNGRGPGQAGGWNSKAPERADRWSVPAQRNGAGHGRGGTPGYEPDPPDNWTSQDVTATDPGRGWDPQDTMAWNPVTAGEWDHPEPSWNDRPAALPAAPPAAPPMPRAPSYPAPPQTQDAAAVWHGSPAPEDTGRWSPPPAAGSPNGSSQPLAITGAAPVAAPGAASATAGGRYVGRRSARKPRVTTQAIFSQLIDLAAIPQSSYAVDTEVDGAMCVIRARGGYEVFSAADQARHEVRFFEDEEAAYFYLFGVLAADAIRNGQLGPQR